METALSSPFDDRGREGKVPFPKIRCPRHPKKGGSLPEGIIFQFFIVFDFKIFFHLPSPTEAAVNPFFSLIIIPQLP